MGSQIPVIFMCVCVGGGGGGLMVPVLIYVEDI